MYKRRIVQTAGALVTALAVLVITQHATAGSGAIGASGGDGPVTYQSVDFKILKGKWKVGSKKYPEAVEYDASKGAWVKQLDIPFVNNTPFGDEATNEDNGNGILPSLKLEEHVVVAGDTDWIDWHETILNDQILNANPESVGSFSWGDDYKFKVKTKYGYKTAPGLTADITDDTVDFNFDPLKPGTQLKIVKEIEYDGGLRGLKYLPDTINVAQYPTVPTPSAAMAGLALLGGLGLRRWRRA